MLKSIFTNPAKWIDEEFKRKATLDKVTKILASSNEVKVTCPQNDDKSFDISFPNGRIFIQTVTDEVPTSTLYYLRTTAREGSLVLNSGDEEISLTLSSGNADRFINALNNNYLPGFDKSQYA